MAKPAAALCFTPRVGQGLDAENLARDTRAPGAIVGYDVEHATYYDIRTDDYQQSFDYFNDFQRGATDERVGVRYH